MFANSCCGDRRTVAFVTPQEYEDYVERVVREFDFWSRATISRNKRFPGVRQPGSYEIDIAFELSLTDLVTFRLIVECKNYTRPVTRPVVQQLAQTRDAINAQKAAVASPSGFSKEAIEVARNLGIALWVIAQDVPVNVVMAYDGLRIEILSRVYIQLRAAYLAALGIVPDVLGDIDAGLMEPTETEALEPSSVNGPSGSHGDSDSRPGWFYRPVQSGSAFFAFEHHPWVDPDRAQAQIMLWVLSECEASLDEDLVLAGNVQTWKQNAQTWLANLSVAAMATFGGFTLEEWDEEVKTLLANDRVVARALSSIRSGDYGAFFKLLLCELPPTHGR
jgi:hypothetical protein